MFRDVTMMIANRAVPLAVEADLAAEILGMYNY